MNRIISALLGLVFLAFSATVQAQDVRIGAFGSHGFFDLRMTAPRPAPPPTCTGGQLMRNNRTGELACVSVEVKQTCRTQGDEETCTTEKTTTTWAPEPARVVVTAPQQVIVVPQQAQQYPPLIVIPSNSGGFPRRWTPGPGQVFPYGSYVTCAQRPRGDGTAVCQ